MLLEADTSFFAGSAPVVDFVVVAVVVVLVVVVVVFYDKWEG